MTLFFDSEFDGEPFGLFSTSHLIALSVVVLFNLSFFLWRNPTEQARRRFRWIVSVVLITNELLMHAWYVSAGQWTAQVMLPLHVCSLLVWTTPLMLIKQNKRLYEFSYFLGIGGATQALLTPDVGIYNYPHVRFWTTFIAHGILVSAPVYMTVVEGFRPTWQSVGKVILGLNVYMVIIFFVNQLLGSNYLYVAHKPEMPTLIDLLGPWPWYILVLEGIGLVLMLVLYLPWALSDYRAKTSTAQVS